jgi:hypothetical protein
MLTELENDSCVYSLTLAREKCEKELAAKHVRGKLSHEYLEKLAAFIAETIAQFSPETSGKPIVDLVLSSARAPSQIVLHIDHSGQIFDVTEELPF